MKQHWPIVIVCIILGIFITYGMFGLAILILKSFGTVGLFIYIASIIAFDIYVMRIKV